MKDPVYQKSWSKICQLAFVCDQAAGERTDFAFRYQNRKKVILDSVKQLSLGKTLAILDLGAFGGDITLELAEMGHQVTWNDIEPSLEPYVWAKYEKGKINYKPGNIFELHITKKYDLVLATEVLEHVAYPEKLLEKMKSFVKPGGYLVVSTPNGDYAFEKNPKFSLIKDRKSLEKKQFGPEGKDHLFALSTTDLKPMARRLKLKVVKTILFNNILTCGNLKLRYIYWLLPTKLIYWFETKAQKMPPKISQKTNSAILMVFKTKKALT